MRLEQLEATVREALGVRGMEQTPERISPDRTLRIHGQETTIQLPERVLQSDSEKRDDSATAEQDKGQLSEQELGRHIETLNSKFKDEGIQLKYTLNEDSGDIQVEVREADSDKVLRKIPADELVKLSTSLKEMAAGYRVGKLVDTSF